MKWSLRAAQKSYYISKHSFTLPEDYFILTSNNSSPLLTLSWWLSFLFYWEHRSNHKENSYVLQAQSYQSPCCNVHLLCVPYSYLRTIPTHINCAREGTPLLLRHGSKVIPVLFCPSSFTSLMNHPVSIQACCNSSYLKTKLPNYHSISSLQQNRLTCLYSLFLLPLSILKVQSTCHFHSTILSLIKVTLDYQNAKPNGHFSFLFLLDFPV